MALACLHLQERTGRAMPKMNVKIKVELVMAHVLEDMVFVACVRKFIVDTTNILRNTIL